MTAARRFRFAAAAALALLLAGSVSVRAELSLFGSYWENIARAAGRNDANEVNRLLADGKTPNQEDENGRTGLQIAAINGNLQIAAILLKAGAHLDSKDRLGNTALFYAVERNQLEMAQLLLDVGATADAENRSGVTPLMVAARGGNLALVRALLAKGANPRKTDFTGRDALSWGQESHRPTVLQLLQHATAMH